MWRAVAVRDGRWEVVEQPPVMFVRPTGMRALPEPVRGGKLTDLRALLNLKTLDDWQLTLLR